MKILICVFAVLVAATLAPAQTIVTENIVTGTTWDLAGSPYMVQIFILVDASSTLTIDPGVVVKFGYSTGIKADNGSSIVAIGTPSYPILFTSAAAIPDRGDWNYVGVDNSPSSEFAHCVFEYGTYNLNLVDSDSPVSFCTVRDAETDGILCERSSPTITNCDIYDNTRGIKANGPDASPVIHYNNLYDNTSYNLAAHGYEELPLVTIDAENNWWGTDVEEEIGWYIYVHPSSEGFVEIDFDPWLHETGIEESMTWGRVKALFSD